MKTCTKCGETKELSEFHKAKRYSQGVRSICKSCVSQVNSDYNKKNNTKLNEQRKAWRDNNKERYKESIKASKEKKKEHYNWMKNQWAIKYRKVDLARKRELQNIRVQNLSDYYLRSMLKEKGFTKEDIKRYPQLIELQKLTLKTKRLCKTLKN